MSARQEKFIKPAPGKSCPKPDGTPLAEEGELIAVTGYWRRRERDGDVIIADRPPRKSTKKEV